MYVCSCILLDTTKKMRLSIPLRRAFFLLQGEPVSNHDELMYGWAVVFVEARVF